MLTSSWPSERRPWAGSFVRDQVRALAGEGWRVTVVAVAPEACGPLLATEPVPWGAERGGAVRVMAARISHGDQGLARGPVRHASAALRRLRQVARAVRPAPSRWLVHWWPLAWAAPQGAGRLTVLHGSDLDRLEEIPRRLRGVAVSRVGPVVAVAPWLALRWMRLTGAARCPPSLALGVVSEPEARPPRAVPTEWAARRDAPRLLTIGRDAPGKGLDVARAARARLGDRTAWAIVTPAQGIGPSEARRLMASADLLVVPSARSVYDGGRGPSEGAPYVMHEAAAMGTPVLAGPNLHARDAAHRLGQAVVVQPGATALALAVLGTLRPGGLDAMRAALAGAVEALAIDGPQAGAAWARALEWAASP